MICQELGAGFQLIVSKSRLEIPELPTLLKNTEYCQEHSKLYKESGFLVSHNINSVVPTIRTSCCLESVLTLPTVEIIVLTTGHTFPLEEFKQVITVNVSVNVDK